MYLKHNVIHIHLLFWQSFIKIHNKGAGARSIQMCNDFSDLVCAWWGWWWGVSVLTWSVVLERWVNRHARRRQPRAFPSAERAHEGRVNLQWAAYSEGGRTHPSITEEAELDAVREQISNWTVQPPLRAGLMLGQQDGPKFNYWTWLASKDALVIDVPSCSWSVGCAVQPAVGNAASGTKSRSLV